MADHVSVLISDPKFGQTIAMMHFIHSAGLELILYEDIDVSDVSGTNDIIREYKFGNEKDALMFRLKFSGR